MPSRASGQKSESDRKPQRAAASTSNVADLDVHRTSDRILVAAGHKAFNQLDCDKCNGQQIGS